jgi:hypothetical protein
VTTVRKLLLAACAALAMVQPVAAVTGNDIYRAATMCVAMSAAEADTMQRANGPFPASADEIARIRELEVYYCDLMDAYAKLRR